MQHYGVLRVTVLSLECRSARDYILMLPSTGDCVHVVVAGLGGGMSLILNVVYCLVGGVRFGINFAR